MVKVSVIIPCYNVENYLRHCLESITNQSLQDIEIICIDDGSTDQTVDILKRYQISDNRVKVLKQKHKGAGAARNAGMRIATGEFLAFIDADDFCDSLMLQTACERAEVCLADIVIYRAKRFWESTGELVECDWTIKKELIPDKAFFSSSEIKKDFFSAISGYVWDKLFRTDFVRKNNIFFQEQEVYNDAFFAYSSLLKADKITFADKVLYYQRKRNIKDSITNQRSLFFDCAYSLLDELKNFLVDNGLYERYKKDFQTYCVHLFLTDLSGRTKKSYQRMRSYLRSKWFAEFELFQDSNYYYNPQEYLDLYNSVYLLSDPLDPEIVSYKDKIIIPVVYATDEGYLKYTIASICSILLQPTLNIYYRIVILAPLNSDTDYKNAIEEKLLKFHNYSLEVIEMGSEFDNAYLEIKHITTPTYYRLLLPDLLKDCDKCIYIDGDTCVCDDLYNLYAIDLGHNYIGAVEALIYYEKTDYHASRLNIKDKKSFKYFNAGVLLMNLNEMRKNQIADQFLKLIGEQFESQDQDIINIVCCGKIQRISSSYNVMTRYHTWERERFETILGKEYANVYLEAVKKPVIVHYANKIKPWDNPNMAYARYWWEAVLLSCWDLFAEDKTEVLMSALYTPRNKNSRKPKNFLEYTLLKIKGGIRCCKDHGVIYTACYFFRKLKRKVKVRFFT